MIESYQFILGENTKIFYEQTVSMPLKHGFDMLLKDMEKVFGKSFTLCPDAFNADIIVRYSKNCCVDTYNSEAYSIKFGQNEDATKTVMYVEGHDELGIIYGLLYISTHYLGVDPFWFWTDKEPQKKKFIEIPTVDYASPQPRVRYRGWFVNDEVCLIGWMDIYPPPREVWQLVFETLLRCGGNMVIPGTDLPRSGRQWSLASEMVLYITLHHAEPLGAEMFFRVYPDEAASYDVNSSLFEGLWEEAVIKQKGQKGVWVLGFRGQGDCPFWLDDPACATYLYGDICFWQHKFLAVRNLIFQAPLSH